VRGDEQSVTNSGKLNSMRVVQIIVQYFM